MRSPIEIAARRADGSSVHSRHIAAGVRTKLVLGNGSYATYGYDATGRLTKLSN